MGFGREARRVRDVSLPRAHRFRALNQCFEKAPMIGFRPTRSYLEARIGCSWREPEFLVPAVELLEDVRRKRALLDARYTPWRRDQKALGRRFPSRGEVSPRSPRRWHGDERSGATHALRMWRWLVREPGVTYPVAVVAAHERALATGSVGDLAELQSVLDWCRRRIAVGRREGGLDEYYMASTTNELLGQLHLLTFGEPVLGTVWNFA